MSQAGAMGMGTAARGVGVLLVLAGVAGACGSEDRSAPVRVDDPGPVSPLAIDAATPASLLDGFGSFFLAIDRCGGLPWMYSNFAAANSYTPPESPGYIGPGPFGGTPVCEAEVPDQ